MALFKKGKNQKTQRPEEFAPPEQDELPPPPVPPEPAFDPILGAIASQVKKVIDNQKVIVQNQQMLLDGITATQQLMMQLAQDVPVDAEEGDEEELSDEEIAAALEEVKKQKKTAKKGVKK